MCVEGGEGGGRVGGVVGKIMGLFNCLLQNL